MRSLLFVRVVSRKYNRLQKCSFKFILSDFQTQCKAWKKRLFFYQMKNIKSYSAQFKIKIIQNNLIEIANNTASLASHTAKLASHMNDKKPPTKKKLSKQHQEFINNISASGFKQFNL